MSYGVIPQLRASLLKRERPWLVLTLSDLDETLQKKNKKSL
jgi:hypothetical protein